MIFVKKLMHFGAICILFVGACGGNDTEKPQMDLVGEKPITTDYAQASLPQSSKSTAPLINVFTIDLLEDLIFRKRRNGWSLNSPEAHVNLEKLKAGGVDLVFSALQVGPGLDQESELQRGLLEMRALVEQTDGKALIVSSLAEAKAVRKDGKMPFMILLEGADALEGVTPEQLFDYKKKGLTAVGLVGARSNGFASSAVSLRGEGLTEKGEAFVHNCKDHGIAVDLTHASEETFWDVLVDQGVAAMVSHSAVKAIRKHPRNLTDLQIIALHKYDGVLGVVFNSDFLKQGKDTRASIDDLVMHYRRIKDLGAVSAAALGTDFGGIKPLAGLEDVSRLSSLGKALKKAGFTDAEISGIFGSNAERFLGAVEAKYGAGELGGEDLLRPIQTECDAVLGDSLGSSLLACDGYVIDGLTLQATASHKLRIREMDRIPVRLEIFGEAGTPWQIEVQNLNGRIMVRRGLALGPDGRGSLTLPGKRNIARIFLSPTRASVLKEAVVWGR